MEKDKKTTKRPGLAIFISVILGLLIAGYGYWKDTQPKIIAISTTEWTVIKMDPKKTWIRWEPLDLSYRYYVEANNDPLTLRELPSEQDYKLVQGVKTLKFLMKPGQDSDTMELKVTRGKR